MPEALNPTAWGEAALEVGTPGAGQTLAETFEDIGYILEETLTLSTEDGTQLSLYSEGHKLRDILEQEGTYTIEGTLVGIPESARTKFWRTHTADGVQWVQSTVSTEKFSVRMGTPKVVGSDRLLVPYSSVKLGMAYASNQGWTAPFSFTIVVGATEDMFGWDVVPAAPVATPASVTIAAAGATENVAFDKAIKTPVANPAAAWLTIGGSGTTWTLTASANSETTPLTTILTATATDGLKTTVSVTQSGTVVG
jgi:hypothetical protein